MNNYHRLLGYQQVTSDATVPAVPHSDRDGVFALTVCALLALMMVLILR